MYLIYLEPRKIQLKTFFRVAKRLFYVHLDVSCVSLTDRRPIMLFFLSYYLLIKLKMNEKEERNIKEKKYIYLLYLTNLKSYETQNASALSDLWLLIANY